jgi:hypothetical protein
MGWFPWRRHSGPPDGCELSELLRSDKTTRDRYAIRGYDSTAVKHGTDVFTAIRDALAGNPWTPPVPASA